MATAGELAMRKVILFVQVSLDGFFEGPKKEIDWHMVDDELFAHVIEELKAMGAFLYGRVTYELMAGTGCPSPVRTTPPRWGELVSEKAVVPIQSWARSFRFFLQVPSHSWPIAARVDGDLRGIHSETHQPIATVVDLLERHTRDLLEIIQ